MTIYMQVSRDKYELPEAVAESASELALMVGSTRGSILSSIAHGYKRFVRINVEDDDAN